MSTIKELKQFCKDMGVRGYSTMKKKELVEFVNKIKNNEIEIKKPIEKIDFLSNINEYKKDCLKLNLTLNNIPSLNVTDDWIYTHTGNNNYQPEYVGKWMLFSSYNNLFHCSSIVDFVPWKCNCGTLNNSEYIICNNCYIEKQETKRDDKFLMTALDLQWLKTLKNTKNGNLGNISAKVSTSIDGYSKTGVIIIYTKDYRDIEDVKKVAKNICKIFNIKRTINYKSDYATINFGGSMYKYNPKTDEFKIN